MKRPSKYAQVPAIDVRQNKIKLFSKVNVLAQTLGQLVQMLELKFRTY